MNIYLQNGFCWCYNADHNRKEIRDLEHCDATCSAGNESCTAINKRHAITMRTSECFTESSTS